MMSDEPEVPKKYAPEGVYLLRTAQQIQYQLSQMADQKASMLLGATFVIFTITVSQIHNVSQPAPLLILGAAAFVSAVLAVIAVLPSTKAPPRATGPANILFFGSFTQVPEEEYVEMLLEVVSDSRTVYQAFAHDIYQNGRILARKKYLFLAYAYRVLLAGLVMSFLAFAASYLGLLG